MDWVPPRLVRRLILAPTAVVLAVLALVLAPFALTVACLIDLVLWRPLPTTRLVAVALVTAAFEGVGVVCLWALWVVAAFVGGVRSARGQEAHHRFLRWWLSSLTAITGRLIGIHVRIEDPRDPEPGPVLVFSRHAGPWDSFLLAHSLVHTFDRRPRIVMKEAMQWSPVIDLVGNRLPNRFIRGHGRDAARFIGEIEDLAHDLGAQDALILFPEGGNFSDRRRLAAIERLARQGDDAHAEEARRLANLIAPRPGGVLAALRGAPEADVVFVAHTGLEPLTTLGELWRHVPLSRPLFGRYWRLPPSDVPPSEGDRVDWLFDWWERIDTWIDSHRDERSQPLRSGR
jgi:1-acyl-sn-glycerol-3-phosphate acyltransferase